MVPNQRVLTTKTPAARRTNKNRISRQKPFDANPKQQYFKTTSVRRSQDTHFVIRRIGLANRCAFVCSLRSLFFPPASILATPGPPSVSQITISCRCSRHRVTKARERAKREGASLSTALRSLLYDYADDRSASVQVGRTCNRLLEEIRRIGVNLNQIARSLNAGLVEPHLTTDLRRLLAKLATVLRDTHTTLRPRKLPTKP